MNTANLCPEEYGRAVYTARSIADLIGLRYDDTNACNVRVDSRSQSDNSNNLQTKGIAYPNPTNGQLTILSDNFESGRLVSTRGVVVMTFNQVSLDISHLPPGLYLLEAFTQDGNKESTRIVKY